MCSTVCRESNRKIFIELRCRIDDGDLAPLL